MKGSQIGAIIGGIAAVIIISIFLIPSESQNEVAPVEDKFLVFFEVSHERPLVGDHQKDQG